MKLKFLLVCCLMLLSSLAFAQTLNQVEQIEKKYQDRLDTGIGMLGTSRDYYLAIDSLLNVAYKNLRSEMAPAEKEALKSDQLRWLKHRDEYFKKARAEYDEMVEKEGWGSDMFMTVYQQDAEYVKERVLYLIKRRGTK